MGVQIQHGMDSQVAKEKILLRNCANNWGLVLRHVPQHKEREILEGRMLLDQVHMLIAISPKYDQLNLFA